MIALRFVLSTIMVVLGAIVVVRTIPFGLEAIPGIVLGGAMIALGIHRINLIRRMRSN